MSGITFILIGGILLAVATVGAGIGQVVLSRKKRRIREQYYHIYE